MKHTDDHIRTILIEIVRLHTVSKPIHYPEIIKKLDDCGICLGKVSTAERKIRKMAEYCVEVLGIATLSKSNKGGGFYYADNENEAKECLDDTYKKAMGLLRKHANIKKIFNRLGQEELKL